MTIEVLHLSDIHLGSGRAHGKLDPETGLNTRLLDFIQSLTRCIDAAIERNVDLVLFGGDAFPNSTPPPYIAEAFASQFRRLAEANIPTVLLVGNHDQHAQGQGGASLCLYRTLVVPGFVVGDRLTTHRITTKSGDVQVVTLPWLTKSTLLTRPETENLSIEEIDRLLIDKLRTILEGEIRQLDPETPAILLAHLMADRATFGAERFLAVRKGFNVPLSLISRPEFSYVALGHVHKHQNLNPDNDPPVVYPGSIDRVDFSEEKEEKGYVLARVDRGICEWEFQPLPVRPFRTISVDLTQADDPLAKLTAALAKADLDGAVVRLQYRIHAQRLDTIDLAALRTALATAHSFTVSPEPVSQLARPRMPELSTHHDPIEALETYLTDRSELSTIRDDLLQAARDLARIDTELQLS
ncbi:MAG: exonuclease subunit SbcD [Geitlerinemataceae cyanobacterium]